MRKTTAIGTRRISSAARLITIMIALAIATTAAVGAPSTTNAATQPSSGRLTSSKAPEVSASPVTRVQLQDYQTLRCLQADTSGRVSMTLSITDCSGSNNQWWDMNITLGALRNVATGACLDSNESGAVYASDCNNANYQSWRFAPANFYSDYVWNVATGRFLDSDDNGAVYTSTYNGANYQAWYHNKVTG